MGYNLEVISGRVRMGETAALIRSLLGFAMEMEMDVIPVNWIVSGTIIEVDLGSTMGSAERLVTRSTVWSTAKGEIRIGYSPIDSEIIQGVVLCHHYEAWILTWNVTHGALLGRYVPPGEFDLKQGVSAKKLLAAADSIFSSAPTEMGGETFKEGFIDIHCPWRCSDVAAACDVLKLISHHADDFVVKDDYGVWPDKDFTKWNNLANKYAQKFGQTPAHPDVTDVL